MLMFGIGGQIRSDSITEGKTFKFVGGPLHSTHKWVAKGTGYVIYEAEDGSQHVYCKCVDREEDSYIFYNIRTSKKTNHFYYTE